MVTGPSSWHGSSEGNSEDAIIFSVWIIIPQPVCVLLSLRAISQVLFIKSHYVKWTFFLKQFILSSRGAQSSTSLDLVKK